uniref:Uncharacterized protein n=1 Tax=Rhizophora mucronata TaxID=61149 RepID=A0A2P2P5F1_RHIMU
MITTPRAFWISCPRRRVKKGPGGLLIIACHTGDCCRTHKSKDRLRSTLLIGSL